MLVKETFILSNVMLISKQQYYYSFQGFFLSSSFKSYDIKAIAISMLRTKIRLDKSCFTEKGFSIIHNQLKKLMNCTYKALTKTYSF